MKKKLLVTLILILATLSIGCNQSNNDKSLHNKEENNEAAFSEALSLLELEEYHLAIEKFEILLERNNDEASLLNLSKAHYALEEYDQALEYILRSVKNNIVNSSEEHRVYGDILYALTDYNQALEEYTIASQIDETNAYAWYGIGLYHESIKSNTFYFNSFNDYVTILNLMDSSDQSAIAAYENAIKHSENANFYVHLLNLYINNSSKYTINNSIDTFKKMMPNLYKKYPDNYGIVKLYGRYLDLQLKTDEALVHYENMASEFDHAKANLLVPEYLFKIGDYQACVDYMATKNPYSQSHSFIELYANAYFALENFDKTYKVVDEYINENSDDYFGYYLKGYFLNIMIDYSSSIEYLEKAVELTNDFQVYDALLLALSKSGEHEKLQKLSLEVLDKFGFKIGVYNDLLKSYVSTEQYKLAANLRIETFNSRDGYLIDEARRFSNQANYEAALEFIKVAIEFQPLVNTKEEYAILNVALTQLGKTDEAKDALKMFNTQVEKEEEINNSPYREFIQMSGYQLFDYIKDLDDSGYLEDIIVIIDLWITYNPYDAYGYYIKGTYLDDIGYYHESVEPFEKALELDSGHYYLVSLFYAYSSSNMYYKAQEFYYEHEEEFSDEAYIRILLADAYASVEEFDKSTEVLENLYQYQPQNHEVIYTLASNYYYYMNDNEKALEYINLYKNQGNAIDNYIADLKSLIVN